MTQNSDKEKKLITAKVYMKDTAYVRLDTRQNYFLFLHSHDSKKVQFNFLLLKNMRPKFTIFNFIKKSTRKKNDKSCNDNGKINFLPYPPLLSTLKWRNMIFLMINFSDFWFFSVRGRLMIKTLVFEIYIMDCKKMSV